MQEDFLNTVPKITVAEFVKQSSEILGLNILAGKDGLETNEITSSGIQKLGLAFAGFSENIYPGRIQVIGRSEIAFLDQLTEAERFESIQNVDFYKVSCLLITNDLEPPKELIQIADARKLPLLRTSDKSSQAINNVTKFLQETLAPHITMHGVLLGMFGIGVLIVGESGIGKSECALDLISKGHSLIADDAVLIKKIGERVLGESPEITYEYLEIRGLGIINIRELFGISSVCKRKQVELLIDFKNWKETVEIERFGLETQEEEFFGVKINKFVLPVSIGRNLATLVETAVRVYLLKVQGFNAAQELFEKHTAMVSGK